MYNLIQGDCLEEMDKLIASGMKVDMVLTDPHTEQPLASGIVLFPLIKCGRSCARWRKRMRRLFYSGVSHFQAR